MMMTQPHNQRPRMLSALFISCLVVGACGGTDGDAVAGSDEAVEIALAPATETPPSATDLAEAPVATDGSIAVSTAPAPPSMATFMPVVDAKKIPLGSPGVEIEQVRTTTEKPGRSDGTGAFRTFCDFTHMAFDDPIVYPGQPGKSHLHAFFGNAGTNANSTAHSIANTGKSSCRGGTANRSAYWVPAVIDTLNGTPVKPAGAGIYYKTGYTGIAPRNVKPFPAGMRMIAGDAKNAAPNGPFRYKCVGKGAEKMMGKAIQNCPVGAELWQEVFFPQCWDGVNLDSPDHKSHMAYPKNGTCPATHPVPTPEITYNIIYKVTEANSPLRWRLASDSYDKSMPAGYSMHGDWFNGWKADVMDAFVKNCDQAAVDCHSHLLGDGRSIY